MREERKQSWAERWEAHTAEIAGGLIAALKERQAPWQRPWKAGQRVVPYNAATGKSYRGSNVISLMTRAMREGWGGTRWCTYKQAQALGAQVRRDTHGTRIVFLVPVASKETDGGADVADVREGAGPLVVPKWSTVFHESQIEGLPPAPEMPQLAEWRRHERADALVKASGADIRLGGNEAAYSPGLDVIRMPGREQFSDADHWYHTLLHELGHWTGHDSRLNRGLGSGARGADYAREELRAEIAALMVCGEIGVGFLPRHSAEYVDHWIDLLQRDPGEVVRASADASRMGAYLLAFEPKQDQVSEVATAGAALPLVEAKQPGTWRDRSVSVVVFVATEDEARGHARARPLEGARYVVLGEGDAVPDVGPLPEAERRQAPIAEVLSALTIGRGPGAGAVVFQAAIAHTREGHEFGRRVRGALAADGLGCVVATPYSIGSSWADERDGRRRTRGRGR